METKIINFFAGPGRGKSTTANGLFYRMKVEGYTVEIVNEYAKEMVLENRQNILEDQLYILAKQNRKISRLNGKVDFIITDSPIILGLNYTKDDYFENFKSLVFDVWNNYHNINFFLHNDGNLTYEKFGRNQTEEEADQIDKKVYNFLIDNNINFSPITITSNNLDVSKNHINDIMERIKND